MGYLTLSRKKQETIIVTAPNGDRITIVMADVHCDKARIAIDAPAPYTIHRGEVQAAIDSGAASTRSPGVPI